MLNICFVICFLMLLTNHVRFSLTLKDRRRNLENRCIVSVSVPARLNRNCTFSKLFIVSKFSFIKVIFLQKSFLKALFFSHSKRKWYSSSFSLTQTDHVRSSLKLQSLKINQPYRPVPDVVMHSNKMAGP